MSSTGSRPPADRGTAYALDTLIVRAAARAVEVSQRQRIAFSIEAVHLATPLAGNLADIETPLIEWLEPAIRFDSNEPVTLVVSVHAVTDGWVRLRFELTGNRSRTAGPAGQIPVEAAPTPRAFTTVVALAPGGAAAGPLDGRRALLVQDPAEDAAAIGAVLAGFGLRTDRVAPGAEAIERDAAAAASPDGAYAFVVLAGATAGGLGLATAEALTARAGALMPAVVLLDARLDADPLDPPRAFDVARVPAAPLDPSVLHGQLLRLLLDQADAVPGTMEAGPPLRVLLAEDHTLNRYVATDMLESMGLIVDLAADGAEALRQVQVGRPDLVLMDVHMPVMDGLEATRRLRACPELIGLPIVAMTANAFAADLQACLDAGMNDHLVKPVDPTTLRAMLARWLPGLAAPRRAAAPHAGPGTAAAPAIEGIDAMAGLRFFADDPVAYRDALGRFAVLYAAGLCGAASATSEPVSRERLRRDLHSLAGAASAVGATALRQEAGQLDADLANPDQPIDSPALAGLDAGLRRLAARILDAFEVDAAATARHRR